MWREYEMEHNLKQHGDYHQVYYWLLCTAEWDPLELSCLKEAATWFWDCYPSATYFRNTRRDFASVLAQITCELTENPNSNTEMDQIKHQGKMTNNLSPNIGDNQR